MNFLKRLFGTAPAQQKATLSSPAHPAHSLVREADAFADTHFKQEVDMVVAVDVMRTGPRLVELIDKAIAVSPSSADLLYAKASAYFATMFVEKGQEALKQALALDPNHFDARMMAANLQHWKHLFCFPIWSEDRTSLNSVMEQRLGLGRSVQLVRDSLQPAIAIVSQYEGHTHKVKRMRWELKWSKTPRGPVAMHYVVLDQPNAGSGQIEAILPHAAGEHADADSGYWLLQRLVHVNSCFLVLMDGKRMARNERFTFPAVLRRTLTDMKAELDRCGPVRSARDINPAAQWHMQNFDLNSLRF